MNDLSRSSSNHIRSLSADLPSELIYIKYIPKDKLLYHLWKVAKKSQYLYFYKKKPPILTMHDTKLDLNYMILNKRELSLTTYYGKLLYIDITNDYLDTSIYNMYNGDKLAELVICALKLDEMQKTILRYYTWF